MTNKSETIPPLNSFITYMQTQFDKCIKVIRTDNRSEFDYKTFCDSFGIIYQTSCIETPQQNCVVERNLGTSCFIQICPNNSGIVLSVMLCL